MGTNRYSYSENDPVNKSDPSGHQAEGQDGGNRDSSNDNDAGSRGAAGERGEKAEVVGTTTDPDRTEPAWSNGKKGIVSIGPGSTGPKSSVGPSIGGVGRSSLTETDVVQQELERDMEALKSLTREVVTIGALAGLRGAPPASAPTGSRQIGMTNPGARLGQARNTDGIINGRAYTGHALDQMQDRGIMPSVIENTINAQNFIGLGSAPQTHSYYDSTNRIGVSVDIDTGRVVTTFHGR